MWRFDVNTCIIILLKASQMALFEAVKIVEVALAASKNESLAFSAFFVEGELQLLSPARPCILWKSTNIS